jgi:hypothetical protein
MSYREFNEWRCELSLEWEDETKADWNIARIVQQLQYFEQTMKALKGVNPSKVPLLKDLVLRLSLDAQQSKKRDPRKDKEIWLAAFGIKEE